MFSNWISWAHPLMRVGPFHWLHTLSQNGKTSSPIKKDGWTPTPPLQDLLCLTQQQKERKIVWPSFPLLESVHVSCVVVQHWIKRRFNVFPAKWCISKFQTWTREHFSSKAERRGNHFTQQRAGVRTQQETEDVLNEADAELIDVEDADKNVHFRKTAGSWSLLVIMAKADLCHMLPPQRSSDSSSSVFLLVWILNSGESPDPKLL